MTYAEKTTGDPNPIKRWLQRRRFVEAVSAVPVSGLRGSRVLDYGAGNGELAKYLAERAPDCDYWAFEPDSERNAEARENLAGLPVKFVTDVSGLPPEGFGFLFCLEVFEHLPEAETCAALDDIARLLCRDGRAVIGVPHELYLPAVLKGVFRMTRRLGDFDARPANILRAALGRPPEARPLSGRYYPHHLGFDHRVLEERLSARFRVVRKWFSPAPPLGPFLNSEIYFCLGKD